MHFTERHYQADILERTRSRLDKFMSADEDEAARPHAVGIKEKIPFLRNLNAE